MADNNHKYNNEVHAFVNSKGSLGFTPNYPLNEPEEGVEEPNVYYDKSMSGVYLSGGYKGQGRVTFRLSFPQYIMVRNAVWEACRVSTNECMSFNKKSAKDPYYFDLSVACDNLDRNRNPLPLTRIRRNKKKEEELGLPSNLTYTRKLTLKRIPIQDNGNGNVVMKNYKWEIILSEGGAEEVKNNTGGTYPKGGTYVEKRQYKANVSDNDMMAMVTWVDVSRNVETVKRAM